MVRTSSLFQLLLSAAVLTGLALVTQTTLAHTDPIKTVTITPEGNKMAFAQKQITVQPGQRVKIIFENTATSPAMQHNLVLLNTAEKDVVRRVGQAALSAEDYVPDDPSIVAATDVAKPGETTSVTFTAPQTPGEYTYVCTYPGHYVSMQGTLVVAN